MNKYGLLPCPFCGSDNVAILGSTLKFVTVATVAQQAIASRLSMKLLPPGIGGRTMKAKRIPIDPCANCRKKPECKKPCFPRIDYLKATKRRRKH